MAVVPLNPKSPQPQEQKMKHIGSSSLSNSDIPRLREEWMNKFQLVMKPSELTLPPFREVNHTIPLIDDNMRYNYYPPKCAESLRPQLMEKIEKYTKAGWWERSSVSQAAPVLCIPKKNGTLRTALCQAHLNQGTKAEQHFSNDKRQGGNQWESEYNPKSDHRISSEAWE